MQNGGIISYEIFESFVTGNHFGAEVLMPTEMELDERITEQMDRERVKDNLLSLEISGMRNAIERAKAVTNVEG